MAAGVFSLFRVRSRAIVVSVLAVFCLCLASCNRASSDLPSVGSEQYRALCSAFYLGLSALQSGEDVNARKGLTRATELAAGEPAAWADLGLLQFRQQDYDGAFQSVQRAQSLVPDNSRLEALLGVIESRRGKVPETLSHLKRAVALDPRNLKALYGLAGETERQNSEASDREAQQLLQQILRAQPNNIVVLVDQVRLSAKRNDAATLKKAVANLRTSSPLWPQPAKQQLSTLERESGAADLHPAAIQAQFLRNVLVRVPAYRQSLDEVKTPVTSAGEPFLRFLKLPSPSSEPAVSDQTLHFESRALADVSSGPLTWIGTFVPDSNHGTQVIWADNHDLYAGKGIRLPLPKPVSAAGSFLPVNAVLAADLNYDFKTDFVIATRGGLRFYRQETPDSFQDVTAQTKLPAAVINGSYLGAWAFDIDLDGDLDVVLGVPEGEPVVLRNNGDGTFLPIKPFKNIEGLSDFASADIDGDGDPDVALLDKDGHLKVFANERLGDYRQRAIPPQLGGRFLKLAAADVNGDGLPDFVALQSDFRVMRLSDRDAGRAWSCAQLATAIAPVNTLVPPSLALADLDNNGGIDLVIGDQVFLSDAHGFADLPGRLPAVARGQIESDGNGRLNVIGLSADGQAVKLVNNGHKQYHWQDVRPRAATTHGDQRINSFGIGGEIEIRSELLTQKQIIESPILHFGLGDHTDAEFARIVWPNGLIQSEFALKANQTLIAEQRLKGSCPLLFAWNGRGMQFLKDVAPMSGALGAHDGSGHIAAISQTEEWFKIDGSQLQPHDGFYDLRVTDEYWETYYIDRYALQAIDHPVGTQIFADERVAVPAAPLKLYITETPHPFRSARDNHGQDVSAAVRDLDGKYLDSFELGSYQGIAHDHWIELELPPDAPRSAPLCLIAQGWLHPWDDGILVAVNQGSQAKPEDLSIEVPDRNGRWLQLRKDLGVPAGRQKTVVLDLTGIFRAGAPRKLRLRTNLEIYWDKLAWARGISDVATQTERLTMAAAELRHRGFSSISRANDLSPEIPNYDRIAGSGNQWQNLEGYYTRYGDVLPLLNGSDNRFVIVAGGDEIRLKFRQPRILRPGWTRDFVFIGDGWVKEGDYSFKNSATVLPLPYHGMKNYSGSLKALENDPVYKREQTDWRDFHTRYVAPEPVSSKLWKGQQ